MYQVRSSIVLDLIKSELSTELMWGELISIETATI